MLNTLKTIPGKLAEYPLAVTVQEAAVNVWSANVNVLVTTRDEGAKVLGVVVNKARDFEARQIKALKNGVVAANDRLNDTWNSVEKLLEQRVVPVLDKVGLATPARFGVSVVGTGLAKVSAQVVELAREPEVVKRVAAKKPAAKKPVTKKVVAEKAAAPRRRKLAA